MSLINELKRRNVFRVGAAYLVVAWLLIQIVDTLSDMLALPDAVGRTILLLLAVGFPVALIVSWIYEVTPDGIATQAAVDAGAKSTSGKKLNAVIIGGMALAIVFLVVDNYVLDQAEPEETSVANSTVADDFEVTATPNLEKSIAVLPFVNLSDDPSQAYFADGLAEELLNKLAQVSNLQVAARTSSFYYKDRNEDMRKIGQDLGVNYILEGSVRKGGNTLRITAQLIQANNGFHLWSDTYDRQLDDIFVIQDEIAESVTTALSVTLRAGEFDRPGMTNNIEAYDHMLRAQALLRGWTTLTIAEAIDQARQAVQIDPQFAQGWITLFDTYMTGVNALAENQTRDMLALLEEATQMAMSIAPESPEVLLMSAVNHMAAGRWFDAEAVLRDLLAMDLPFKADVYTQLGILLLRTGQIDDSLVALQTARRLAPYSDVASSELQHVLATLNRDAEAAAETARARENNLGGMSGLVWGYANVWESGNSDYLRTQYNNGSTLPEANFTYRIADIIDSDDPVSDLRAMLDEMNAGGFNSAIAFFNLSEVAAMKGEPELSLSLRQSAFPFAQTSLFFVWLDVNSEMRRLPAFKDFVADMGLVEYWRTTGNWGDYCRPLDGNDDFECF